MKLLILRQVEQQTLREMGIFIPTHVYAYAPKR